jgi:hypothetical protein
VIDLSACGTRSHLVEWVLSFEMEMSDGAVGVVAAPVWT